MTIALIDPVADPEARYNSRPDPDAPRSTLEFFAAVCHCSLIVTPNLPVNRYPVLPWFLLSFLGLLAASAAIGQVDWPQLRFTQVASGTSVPTSIADPGDGSGRLFVTEQSGRVMLA